jgi:hypothetical protein
MAETKQEAQERIKRNLYGGSRPFYWTDIEGVHLTIQFWGGRWHYHVPAPDGPMDFFGSSDPLREERKAAKRIRRWLKHRSPYFADVSARESRGGCSA